jgi:hypothetical protein
MPRPVHLVLSIPPAGVSDGVYSDFYETHLAEILETPGFIAARRYWLAPAVAGRPPVEYRHAAVYELDRPSAEPLAELGGRGDAGELTLPGWFGEIRFASFDCRPLEEEELELPDHGYMTLSHAPQRFTTDEYHGWYYAHARENLTSEGLHTVRRFALTPATLDPPAQVKVALATHLAFYSVTGELAALRRALDASASARRVDVPGWLGECDFTSFDCHAPAPARERPLPTGP